MLPDVDAFKLVNVELAPDKRIEALYTSVWGSSHYVRVTRATALTLAQQINVTGFGHEHEGLAKQFAFGGYLGKSRLIDELRPCVHEPASLQEDGFDFHSSRYRLPPLPPHSDIHQCVSILMPTPTPYLIPGGHRSFY